jgi:hypothetical protein
MTVVKVDPPKKIGKGGQQHETDGIRLDNGSGPLGRIKRFFGWSTYPELDLRNQSGTGRVQAIEKR